MPSEVFEEPLELEIDILEAGPPTRVSYPYPSLALTGRSEKRTFQSVILENPYLRAVVVPTLGGRILSLFDKRTSTEVLPPPRVVAGGRRGARMIGGIELHLDGAERATSLAACQFAAHENEEDDPAIVWLAEAVTGTGLSWHLRISLAPDRAELDLEARVFNRSFREVPYNAGLLLPEFIYCGAAEGRIFAHTLGNGIACHGPDFHFGRAPADDGPPQLRLSRFAEDRLIAPRQTDTWRLSIQPLSDLPGVIAVGEAGALAMEGNRLRIQSAAVAENHKLVLLTRDGQTLESPFKAYPEHIAEFELPDVPSAVAVLDPAKRVLLKWEGNWPEPAAGHSGAPATSADWAALERSTARFEVATRHAARVLDANDFVEAGNPEAAEESLEQALLYDGEDHLAWWSKAVLTRIGGGEGESAELLNAHYLAPLEPALRAESFLAQPRRVEKEPSALLTPMAEHPENFIEVACLLIEIGHQELAAYWIDEALRHEDLPMLRYLLAYSHLQASGLDYEAATQVEAAGRAALTPPFPWRDLEWRVVDALSQRFPQDPRLRSLAAMKDFARR